MDVSASPDTVEKEEWVTPDLIELQAEDARSGGHPGNDGTTTS